MQKKVLVALDNSTRAARVFDVGAEFSQKYGAELYLFQTIVVPQEFPAAGASTEADTLPTYLMGQAEKVLLELAKRAPKIVVKERIITFGLPAKMILDTADKLDVDLIVMGSHGYRGWDHVLGTTAAAIANRSSRNVLIVHEGKVGKEQCVRSSG